MGQDTFFLSLRLVSLRGMSNCMLDSIPKSLYINLPRTEAVVQNCSVKMCPKGLQLYQKVTPAQACSCQFCKIFKNI